jgi:hypothetical protein
MAASLRENINMDYGSHKNQYLTNTFATRVMLVFDALHPEQQ